MEENTVTSVVNKLSVILTREPLVGQRYKNKKVLHHNDCTVSVQLNDKKHLYEENFSHSKKKKRTAVEELINIYKRHSLPYKECKVILERLDINTLKQVQDGVYSNKLVAVHRNVNNEVQINFGNHLASEKIPIYKHVMTDKFNDHDLYEFDEADCENVQNVNKAIRNKKKKAKPSKQISKRNTQKPRIGKTKIYNTYDATVREILQKVMKKVINDKLKDTEPTQIQNKILHEHNMNCSIQPHNLSNVGNVGECNDIEADANISEKSKENKTFCDYNAKNNNSEMVCFFYNRPVTVNKKIHIISDITLDQSDDSFFDDNLQPDANSTALLNKERSPPWRFNDNVKRNPHYLSIKKTALPCLQQDMILDHTQLEKIEEHFAKISRKSKKRVNKSTRIEESGLFHDTIDKENLPNSSLFNSENFIINQPKLNKQNRNILGPKLQNANNISNIMNVQENNVVEIPASQNKISKFSNAETLDTILDTSQNSLKESVNNNFVVKLFEDEEPVINFDENSKIYIPKIRRKKKFYGNIEESNQDKHKREMTKKEEAELEQWAAKFNSLCEDIENYKLDIE